MKKRLITLGLIFVLLFMTSCGAKPLESGKITKDNVSDVCKVMEDAGLSNVDILWEWIMDPAAQEESETKDFADADCRMTVMLLAGDLIKYKNVEKKYNGTYLMFDMESINNNPRYHMLKEKKRLFTTMFGETPVFERGFDMTLPENWKKHGIKVNSNKVSIISILFTTYGEREAFVGHTGLLVDCRDVDSVNGNYMFVEKIAFGEPFVITMVENEKELAKILSERPEYTPEDGETAPVIYKNEEKIGAIKK